MQDGVVKVGHSEERSTLWPNHAMTINKMSKAKTRLPKTSRALPTNSICITKRLGRLGEDVAARYLVSRGYEIIARNWTCQAGEADIIARDDDILVFAEVKNAIEYRERLSQRSRRQQKAWEVSQDRRAFHMQIRC